MTTRTEQKRRIFSQAIQIRNRIAFAFKEKYMSFFFRTNGRLDEAVALTLCYVCVVGTFVFVSSAWEIVLTVWWVSCILFLFVPWQRVLLRLLGTPPKT